MKTLNPKAGGVANSGRGSRRAARVQVRDPLSLSLTHALSLSLSHTLCVYPLSLCLSHTNTHCVFSLSLTHTHARTHTHTHTLSLSLTHSLLFTGPLALGWQRVSWHPHGTSVEKLCLLSATTLTEAGLQGYLAHRRLPPPLGPPQSPGHGPAVRSQWGIVSHAAQRECRIAILNPTPTPYP